MQEVQPSVQPLIVFLLTGGGFPLLAWGLAVAAVGLVLLFRPSRNAGIVVLVLALVPALLGLIAVYSAAGDYTQLAVASEPPKPSEFASVTGRALSHAFCGLLGTFAGGLVGVLALGRACRTAGTSTRSDLTEG